MEYCLAVLVTGLSIHAFKMFITLDNELRTNTQWINP